MTMIGIINALGNNISPIYGHPRKRNKSFFLTWSVVGAVGFNSDNGWMVSESLPSALANLHIWLVYHSNDNTKIIS